MAFEFNLGSAATRAKTQMARGSTGRPALHNYRFLDDRTGDMFPPAVVRLLSSAMKVVIGT